ncbi:antagonist of like heterochromatin protein 1-like protein [Tanacetum coccineum]
MMMVLTSLYDVFDDYKGKIGGPQGNVEDAQSCIFMEKYLAGGFLWCQGEMCKGKAKVAWEDVCLPKIEGGLGNSFAWKYVVGLAQDSPCHLAEFITNRDIYSAGFSVYAKIAHRAIILWLVIKRKLKTQDMLRQWDVHSSTNLNLLQCPLCGTQTDSDDHLFFACSFSLQFLRKPTLADIEKTYELYEEKHELPRMLGSIDFMHWEWRNCPKSLHGQFKRKDHKHPTLILEAVVGQILWIWHAYFGVPEANNDLNVLYGSPLFDNKLADRAPKCPFVVNGHTYTKGYYLADDIYLAWATFVKT